MSEAESVRLPATVTHDGYGSVQQQSHELSRRLGSGETLGKSSMTHTHHRPIDPRAQRHEGGGYWLKKKGVGEGLGGKFVATSTHRAEIGPSKQEASAPTQRQQHPAQAYTLPLRNERPPAGYATEHGDMVVKQPHTGGDAAPGAFLAEEYRKDSRVEHEQRSPASGASVRRKLRDERPKRMEGQTMYRVSFGRYGSDPLEQDVHSPEQQTQVASTRELDAGSSRSGRFVPGYSGFVPSSSTNKRALEHGSGMHTHENHKSSMLLGTLDQYHRGALPGYQGHRPQAPRNAGREQAEPLGATMTSKSLIEGQSKEPPKMIESFNLQGKRGCQAFFSSPADMTESEEGKAQSERYYAETRPFEGTLSVAVPSKTTASGRPFNRKALQK